MFVWKPLVFPYCELKNLNLRGQMLPKVGYTAKIESTTEIKLTAKLKITYGMKKISCSSKFISFFK